MGTAKDLAASASEEEEEESESDDATGSDDEQEASSDEEDEEDSDHGDEDNVDDADKQQRVQADIEEMRKMVADMDKMKMRLQFRFAEERRAKLEQRAREERECELQAAARRKAEDEVRARQVEASVQTEYDTLQQQREELEQRFRPPDLRTSVLPVPDNHIGDMRFADAAPQKKPAGLSLYDLVKASGFDLPRKAPSPVRQADPPALQAYPSEEKEQTPFKVEPLQPLLEQRMNADSTPGWQSPAPQSRHEQDSIVDGDASRHSNGPESVHSARSESDLVFDHPPSKSGRNVPSARNSIVSSIADDPAVATRPQATRSERGQTHIDAALFSTGRASHSSTASGAKTDEQREKEAIQYAGDGGAQSVANAVLCGVLCAGFAPLRQLIGNISTALILVLFYFNFLLFENYLRLIVWAILFSQALRQAKNNVISVLQYLSDDADVDRYVRRGSTHLFLNYGIFLFSLIGAVSIWMRMYSWVSFLNVIIGFWIVSLSLIKILDRRIFYYRYFISDEVLVSALLILGFFITGVFVVLYLGTESYLEGSRAATDLSDWVQENFINDERTRQIWSEQVENSRAMISEAISGVEVNYNDTMWWPPLKSLVKTYYLDAKSSDGNLTSHTSLFSRLRLPENMTLVQAVSFAYSKVDSVNLTSVQLTDWTSKGLEVSGFAVGSVAQLVFLLFTLLIAFVSLGVRSFFFISSLFYLLCTNWDPVERFVEDLLPIQVDKRPDVVRSMRKVIEGVFFLPLKMSSIHAIVTLVSFTIVVRTVPNCVAYFVFKLTVRLLFVVFMQNADFVYLATTFTFFISIVPIIPPYLVCVPWVISIGVTSSVVKALALFGVQYMAFTVLDDMLYEKSIVALNSYVSALSVVFGVYVFGFEGVIFGPLIVCGVTFAYDVSNHGIQAAQDEHGRSDEARQENPIGGSDGEESRSVGSSAEDEDNGKESTEPSEEDADRGMNTNIFSNAMYRVISGPLVDRVRRRLSIDIATEDSVCVTLVVEGLKTSRKVRFVVNKTWNQKTLHDNIRRMLHVQAVECIYTAEGVEVLSPLHIIPDEVLHVKVRSKHRVQLYSDASLHSELHPRVSFPLRALSPSYHGIHTSVPPRSHAAGQNSPTMVSTGTSPHLAKPKRAGTPSPTVGIVHGATVAQRQAHESLQRRHSGMSSHQEGGLKRRGSSYNVAAPTGSLSQPLSVRRSVSGSAWHDDLPLPLPSDLAVKRSSSSSASSTHEYEFLSDEEHSSTPTKEKLPSDGRSGGSAGGSADGCGTLDLPSPASVNSAKGGKPKLNFVDLSDSASFTTSPVSCDTPEHFGGNDEEKDETESGMTTEKPDAKLPVKAKAKRRISLATQEGTKLIFSPLAVGVKNAPARSYSSSEGDGADRQQLDSEAT
ncbi:hypothetical protein BBJ28_00015583 [Nothophytophthora sp. Chile5]|nr:hypothetical protein BBJ28_00015583 [Nothophytophthora sp. Chile5]